MSPHLPDIIRAEWADPDKEEPFLPSDFAIEFHELDWDDEDLPVEPPRFLQELETSLAPTPEEDDDVDDDL